MLVDRRLELQTLSSDNSQSLEKLLKSHYSGYYAVLESGRDFDKLSSDDSSGMEDCDEEEDEEESSSEGSEVEYSDVMSSDEDEEEEEFSLETAEQVGVICYNSLVDISYLKHNTVQNKASSTLQCTLPC